MTKEAMGTHLTALKACSDPPVPDTCNAGDLGSTPGLERSSGEGKDYPLPYSGLENSMDCVVHGLQSIGHG